jgi:polysaccharide pyruvyl transferase WcaK-like protein
MNIGLLDHMGYGNLGDAATQEALIANIRARVLEARIVGFSLNPVDTEMRHGIPSYSITNWHPGLDKPGVPAGSGTGNKGSRAQQLKSRLKKIPVLSPALLWTQNLVRELRHLVRSFHRVKSLDVLIIAGGGQLCELWRGPWSHPYNVFKFSLLTKLARKKLLIVNVGAGPLESRLAKTFIKWSVRLADYVSFRDVESQALVRALGIRQQTWVCPDSAYALDVSRYANRGTVSGRKPLVGINPIGFCDPRIWPKKDASVYSRYLDSLAEFLLWLWSENYRLKVFSAERSVDLHALEDLKGRLEAEIPKSDVDRIFVAPSEDVEDLLTGMSEFDYVITSKFHGVVFSHLLEKPVMAISYHRKIDDLMRMVGDSERCLSIESFDTESLQQAFGTMVESAQTLQGKYRQTVTRYTCELGLQFDYLFAAENFEPRSTSLNPATNRAVGRESA